MSKPKAVRKGISISEDVIKAGKQRGRALNRNFSNYIQDLICRDIRGEIMAESRSLPTKHGKHKPA